MEPISGRPFGLVVVRSSGRDGGFVGRFAVRNTPGIRPPLFSPVTNYTPGRSVSEKPNLTVRRNNQPIVRRRCSYRFRDRVYGYRPVGKTDGERLVRGHHYHHRTLPYDKRGPV